MKRKIYEKELKKLHVDLVRLQNAVIEQGARVAVIFEGRDAAGKGGTIKRVMAPLNPRHARVVALKKPTEAEQSQWYFQRYVQHLPSAGEIVLFDRSWYNRAGVEPVMSFCTPEQHESFLEDCPTFERLLFKDGIYLIKYWFSVSAEEQEKRLQARVDDPVKRWKISSIDIRAREKWQAYEDVKDRMFEATDIEEAPWHVVPSDDKKSARLNCIHHMISKIPLKPQKSSMTSLPVRNTDPRDLTTSGSEEGRLVPLLFGGG